MLVGVGGIVFFVSFVLWIWAIFDCISTDSSLCRNLPKGFWLILIILLPTIGAVAWLILGRPERAGWRQNGVSYRPGRPVVGEDLRYQRPEGITDRRSAELDERLAAWEREQAATRARESGPAAIEAGPGASDLDGREAEVARREEELRRRELELRERERERRERALDDD